MISFTKLPASVAFSLNSIPIAITSDNYIKTVGVGAVIYIYFKSATSEGLQLPMLWSGANFVYSFAANPDDSGYQLPSGDGSNAYVQSLIPILQDNSYIDTDFSLLFATYIGYPAIALTARKTGVYYNIAPYDSISACIAIGTPGVTQELQPNFAHHLEIWLKQAGVFTKIYGSNLQLEPNSGVTQKDIAEILHPYLKDQTDRPSLTSNGWQECVNSFKEYYLRTAQYYGDTPLVRRSVKSASFKVNLGGLDVQRAYSTNLSLFLQPGGSQENTLCLRQGSKVTSIQKTSPEYLYWINFAGTDQNAALKIEIFFNEGGSKVQTIQPFVAKSKAKYYTAVGYTALNIDSLLPAGKTCSYYTARIINNAGFYLSALYTYIIDKYRAWPRFFIYLNSLGGYQTLYTWGKGQHEADRTKTDIRKQVTNTEAAVNGAFGENNIRLQHKYTVYTGYMSKRDLLLLNDFFLSTEKYLVNQGRLIPVGISTDNIKFPEDGNGLAAAAFTFNPLYDELVFTDNSDQGDNPGGTGTSDMLTLTNHDQKVVITPTGRKILIPNQ